MSVDPSNNACDKWPATAPFFGGPYPTRTWFRAGNAPCSGTAESRALARKTEVLQYKGNSARLTQKQKWAQFAKGKSQYKKQSWASQTQTVTNPNVSNLPQVGNTLLCPYPTIDIVGEINTGTYRQPAYWELLKSEPQFLNIGTFTLQNITASDINSNKNIVGTRSEPLGDLRGIYWNSLTSIPIDLDIGAYNNTGGSGINNAQIIVGIGITGALLIVPIYWSSPSAAPATLNLVAPYSGRNSEANKINNNNEIVGEGTDGTGTICPLYWSSLIANPSTLNLVAPYIGNNSEAIGINNKSQIVGNGRDGLGNVFPLYWSSPTDDPITLNLGPYSSNDAEANDINDDGIIVGFYNNGVINVAIYWTSPTATEPIPFNINPYSGNASQAFGIKF